MYSKHCKIILSLLSLLSILSYGQSYRTQIFDKSVHTLLVHKKAWPISHPVIELKQEQIQISFDQLQTDEEDLYYRIHLCDANWKILDHISLHEYMTGFPENPILDFAYSFNTSVPYVNYKLVLPNEDVSLKSSGNYVVEIFNINQPDTTMATACFSVVDSKVQIHASTVALQQKVQKNQQVNITINHPYYPIYDPSHDTYLVVSKNNQRETSKVIRKPTIALNKQLLYQEEKTLLFEGGNEYRRFDISHKHLSGKHVHHVAYHEPYHHVSLYTDLPLQGANGYTYNRDNNGKTWIELDGNTHASTEAEYVFVHFSYACPNPFLSSKLQLFGGVTNKLSETAREMKYNFDEQCYTKTLLLKQGMHEYQYLLFDSLTGKHHIAETEGNYWETENEYCIYFYHRPPGERYDHLIGFTVVSINHPQD